MDSLLLQKEELSTSLELSDRISSFIMYLDNSPFVNHGIRFIVGFIGLFIFLYLILEVIYSPTTRLRNDLYDEVIAARAFTGNAQPENRNLLHPYSPEISWNSNFELRRLPDEDVDIFLPFPARNADTFSFGHTSSGDSVLSTINELWDDVPPPYTSLDTFTSTSFQDDDSNSSLEDRLRVYAQNIRHRNVYLPSYEEVISETIECEEEYRQSRSYISSLDDSDDEPPSYEEATDLHNNIM
ncbi:hypothetical protein THOM_0925 [Trachipleistophora hominis]|uniref:Uncharacterized protein n=1 Tax=Trachipleistophora hominis TaxID=72359 RepID=L7JXP1_TRAHO|nr:hypothetical protein THOM_0925 [Trachipleistophora hominis]